MSYVNIRMLPNNQSGLASAPSDTKVNLLDLDQTGMVAFFKDLGETAYRGQQVFSWIHQHGVLDFSKMTNLSKALRGRLEALAICQLPEIALDTLSADGTRKWLLRLPEGNCIETVFIPEGKRGTLCVSSQVGCALNCSFCSTAKQGFARNLSVSEIIGQVFVASHALAETSNQHDCTQATRITNIVMMGMGEPLLNFDNVVSSMQIMLDDRAYGLAKRRVTLSTSGIAPKLRQLREVSEVALALSLHAPTDELRNELVPINKKYPLAELMDICRNYFPRGSKRVVTMEYVMLKDINDTEKHAKQLIKLLANVPCKLNLIPFNPYPLALYERSSEQSIQRFWSLLSRAGIRTIVRKTRGEDINAACGQLAGQFKDKTSRRRLLKQKAQVLQS